MRPSKARTARLVGALLVAVLAGLDFDLAQDAFDLDQHVLGGGR